MGKEGIPGAVSGSFEQMKDDFSRDGSAKLKLGQEEVPQVMGELIEMIKDSGSGIANMVIKRVMKVEVVRNLINNPNGELFRLLEEQGIRPESIGFQLTRQGMEIGLEGKEQEVTKNNYQEVLMGRIGGIREAVQNGKKVSVEKALANMIADVAGAREAGADSEHIDKIVISVLNLVNMVYKG
jgi:hypothetical protein